ncbi:MAG: Crp/Fnr family transcriptional regulator [Acidobacteriota bacterium]
MRLTPTRRFNAESFLSSTGVSRRIVAYRPDEAVFRQGDPSEHLLFIQDGAVKLSARSNSGRQAIVAMLGPREFFGEGCLAGQPVRGVAATAMTVSAILHVDKEHMLNVLRSKPEVSDFFIVHMLARNMQIEEDLLDHLFSSDERRLARTLLLLGPKSGQDPLAPFPRKTLAKMAGMTPSHADFFMKKFRRLGLIGFDGKNPVTINSSLLRLVPSRPRKMDF